MNGQTVGQNRRTRGRAGRSCNFTLTVSEQAQSQRPHPEHVGGPVGAGRGPGGGPGAPAAAVAAPAVGGPLLGRLGAGSRGCGDEGGQHGHGQDGDGGGDALLADGRRHGHAALLGRYGRRGRRLRRRLGLD